MKPMSDEDRAEIARLLRAIAAILEPQAGEVSAQGGGNGNGPPGEP